MSLFLNIYKVHIHKNNNTKFYAIILKMIFATYRNKAHPVLYGLSLCYDVKISQAITGLWLNKRVTALLTWYNNIGKITVLFNHVLTYCYSLGIWQWGSCSRMLEHTTTKFMPVVVTSLFNLVISLFADNMFYHV